MLIVAIQVLGVAVLLIGTLVIGRRVRRVRSGESAEHLCRVSHALFWGGLVLPELTGALYPGLTSFDRLLGIPSLPSSMIIQVIGWLLLIPGLHLLGISNLALRKDGLGFAAFKLTKSVVVKSVYQQVRNPMSLGYYLACLGIGLISESTYLVLGSVLLVIPVHLFNLHFFEEHELLARYGNTYSQYMANVPFIIPRICRIRA